MAFHFGWAGVTRVVEQALCKAVGIHRLRVADHTRHQPRDNLDQRHRRDLAAAEDIVSYGHLFGAADLDHPLVEALVAAAHQNNTVFLRWFETARIAYLERVGIHAAVERDAVGPILARQSIDYRLPVTYPDRVRVATTVTRLGTRSFVMAFRITSRNEPDQVAAEGEGVVVMLDYGRGQTVPLGEALRAAILAFEATGSESR